MRIVKEIPLPDLKITIFSWNNKYLLKFEQGLIEQTYKIPETELTSENDLDNLLNEGFISKVRARFKEMQHDLQEALFLL